MTFCTALALVPKKPPNREHLGRETPCPPGLRAVASCVTCHFLKCTLNVLPSHRLSDCEYASNGRDQNKSICTSQARWPVAVWRSEADLSISFKDGWMDSYAHADTLASMGFSFKVVGLGWRVGRCCRPSPADQPDSRLQRHQRIILTFETSHRRDSRTHRAIEPSPKLLTRAGGHFHSSICGVSL